MRHLNVSMLLFARTFFITLPRPFAALAAGLRTRSGRNLSWNLAGQVLPLLTGLVFVPILIRTLGTDRFGFLSLVWVLIGYFSLFDLGLARALTQRVAALIAVGDIERLRSAVRTGMALIAALSLGSVPLLLLFKAVLLKDIVHANAGIVGEASSAFTWLAIGVPIVILAAGVRGLLEGQHRFLAVNLVRTPAGMAMFIAPWLATLISPTLQAVTFSILAVRIIQLGGFVILARRLLVEGCTHFGLDHDEVRMLFGFGIWVTVSNIIGPVLVYIDRFVLSHYGNLTDITYYSTPFDLISRSLFVSTAVASVMFPALTAALASSSPRIHAMIRQNYLILLLLFGPLTVAVLVLARPGLNLWLGPLFAARSTFTLQVLAVGVFINALSTVPYSLLQAMRRADLTAKVHLVELPFYLVLLIILVQHYGIVGAASAWVIRVAFDLVAMTILARRQQYRIVLLS